MFENVLDSHVIFHLPQLPYDVHGVLFARCLLHCRILSQLDWNFLGELTSVAYFGHHKHVVLLEFISRSIHAAPSGPQTFSSPMVNLPWVCLLF